PEDRPPRCLIRGKLHLSATARLGCDPRQSAFTCPALPRQAVGLAVDLRQIFLAFSVSPCLRGRCGSSGTTVTSRSLSHLRLSRNPLIIMSNQQIQRQKH